MSIAAQVEKGYARKQRGKIERTVVTEEELGLQGK
jgi:hypothetical protein